MLLGHKAGIRHEALESPVLAATYLLAFQLRPSLAARYTFTWVVTIASMAADTAHQTQVVMEAAPLIYALLQTI